jgi:hypothetical protein
VRNAAIELAGLLDGELVDHCPSKRREVLRDATADEIAVNNDGLVDPRRAGIGYVVADAHGRRELPSPQDAGGDEYPGSMTDGRHHLPGFVYLAHPLQHVTIATQLVGSPASRHDDAGKRVGQEFTNVAVGLERIPAGTVS